MACAPSSLQSPWQPSTGFTPVCQCPSGDICQCPKLDTVPQLCSPKGWADGNCHCLNLLATALLLIQHSMCWLLYYKDKLLSHVQLVSTPTSPSPWLHPSPFLQSCSLVSPTPTLQCFIENLYPKCKNLHVLWLNFMRFLSARISSLPSSLSTAALPTSILSAHLRVAADLLRMCPGPSSRSWIKMVDSLSPITNPEGMPLLTRCQLDFMLLITPPNSVDQVIFHSSL